MTTNVDTASAGETPLDYSNIVVLLARQRSGTNAFRSVLGSHPEIYCHEEVLNPEASPAARNRPDYFEFLSKRFRGQADTVLKMASHHEAFLDFLEYLYSFTDKRYVVVDIKYSAVHHIRRAWQPIGSEPLLFELLRDHGVRVLHVTRLNYLRYQLSELKAAQTDRWHAYDPAVVGDEDWFRRDAAAGLVHTEVEDHPVFVEVEELLDLLDGCARETQLVREVLARGTNHLELEYEDMFTSGGLVQATVLEAVAQWLGVDAAYAQSRPSYRKQSHLLLQQSILNYDEVAAALSGTTWEHCLDDERLYVPSPAKKRHARATTRKSTPKRRRPT